MSTYVRAIIILSLGLFLPMSPTFAVEIKCAPGSTFVKCPKTAPTPAKKILPTKQPSLRDATTAKKCFETSKALQKCLSGR